jgi:hypothetical protein
MSQSAFARAKLVVGAALLVAPCGPGVSTAGWALSYGALYLVEESPCLEVS